MNPSVNYARDGNGGLIKNQINQPPTFDLCVPC